MGRPGSLRRRGDLLVIVLAVGVDLLVWGGVTELRGGGSLPILVIPVLTVAVYAALALRWRHPVGVFVLQWVYALIVLVVPGYAPFVGLLVAVHAVATRRPRTTALLALAACAVPFAIDCAASAGGRTNLEVSSLISFAAQFLLYMLLTAVVWGFGRHSYAMERQRLRVEREHAEQTAQAQLLHERAAQEAIRAERLRLARELHDIVGDGVTAMVVQAAGARTLDPNDEQVGKSLALIEETGVSTMGELHRMLGLLRAADGPESAQPFVQPPTLRDHLDQLVAVAEASGVTVDVSVEGVPRTLDRSIDTAAYRIVQEGLTNTVKHAGPGASVALLLAWGDERLTVQLRDRAAQPVPADRVPFSSGFGLLGLGERVTLLGGRLDAGPVDGGFLLRAELPLRSPTDPATAASPVTSSAPASVPGQLGAMTGRP